MNTLLGRIGLTAAVAFGVTVAMATPAVADETQYTYCNFGETGRTKWREPEDYAGSLGVTFIWRNRHNDLYETEVAVWFNGPRTLHTIHSTDDYWAPFGVRVSWDLQRKGAWCEAGSSVATQPVRDLTTIDVLDESRGEFPPPPPGVVVLGGEEDVQEVLDDIVCC